MWSTAQRLEKGKDLTFMLGLNKSKVCGKHCAAALACVEKGGWS